MNCVQLIEVMPFAQFHRLLQQGSAHLKGFIALASDYLRLKAALELPELQAFPAINVIDCDSIWIRRAWPPNMIHGHAAGTLALNPVSQLNRDMGKRLMGLTLSFPSTAIIGDRVNKVKTTKANEIIHKYINYSQKPIQK